MKGLGQYGWVGFALFLLIGGFLVYQNPELAEKLGEARSSVRAKDPKAAAEAIGSLFQPAAGGSSPGVSTAAGPSVGTGFSATGVAPISGDLQTIRIGTFNLKAYGPTKAARTEALLTLGYLISLFDVCAVQEIRSINDPQPVQHLLASVNQASQRYGRGDMYDMVIGPPLGRSNSKEQYAYFYNTRTLFCDKDQVYTVHDPNDLLHREPLVAWFRTRTADPRRAFTFTLVNIHTDPNDARREVNVLDDVVRVVRADGRGEDDVILLGDLNVNGAQLGDLSPQFGFMGVLDKQPTNILGTQQYDHILFDRVKTAEYLGPGGTIDFVKMFNLTIDQAILISDHLPVGGTFSAFEADRFATGGGFPVR